MCIPLRLFLLVAMLCSAGCHLIFPYQDNPDSELPDAAPADGGQLDGKPKSDTAPKPDADQKSDGLADEAGIVKDRSVDLPAKDQLLPCPAGQVRCNGKCVNTGSDPKHCGGCNKPCGAGVACKVGKCVCLGGGLCSGCCQNNTCRTSQPASACGIGGKACLNCDDNLACTADKCVAASGACSSKAKPGLCAIDGSCHAQGAITKGCLKCDTAKSSNSWSAKTSGGCVADFAGGGAAGQMEGSLDKVQIDGPRDVLALANGDLVITDTKSNRVRLISRGKVTTLAGSSTKGDKDGPGKTATFGGSLHGLAVDDQGNIYVADVYSQKIRKVSSAGVVSTVAGSKSFGFKDGAANLAKFNYPRGVAVAKDGAVFVADTQNNRIRMIASKKVSTLAGTGAWGKQDGPGAKATFNAPNYIRVGYSGATAAAGYQLVVVDGGNNCLRRVSVDASGNVTVKRIVGSTTAGSQQGALMAASFDRPSGITRISLTAAGSMTTTPFYVAGQYNHLVRRVTSSAVSLLAGKATSPGATNGQLVLARFYRPVGITQSGDALYVADDFNDRIRIIVR